MKAVKRVYDARELLWNFTLRELRTKYRRSFLGWTWSLLNPLAAVAIYGFVFGLVFRATPPVGDPSGIFNFALFLVCGLIPWNFFALINNLGIESVSANASLVKRVAFPREILVFSNVLHACVQFSIELTILVVIMAIVGSPLLPWVPVLILVSVLFTLFATGIGLVLAAASVYFRDLKYLWLIVLQAWFFATPIVYPPSLVDEQIRATERMPNWTLDVLEANPVAMFVRAYRRLLYDGGAPSAGDLAVLAVISVVSLAIGWWVFLRLSSRFAEEV